MWDVVLIALYGVVLLALAVYGFHRSTLVYLYYRFKNQKMEPLAEFDELPKVTVQLPMFNEMYVVERLLDATAQLDYPWDRLEIQVLDDSTDETQGICQKKVAELQERGLDVKYLHREDRTGFKAGALENGLKHASGEFVLVFDADFVPHSDILKKSIHFFTDPEVGMVQVRWGHLNRNYSLLTQVQSVMLDGHFIIEHSARHRSGRFFNFNGTAGIWRRQAIETSGGWQHDTLTEDMDLSYRAQLKGWKFVYLPNIVSPAEVPVEMTSFKSQQFRWAKGSIQVARKVLPEVFHSNVPWQVKMEAFFHLTNNFAYPLLFLLSLLLLPNLLLRTDHGWREVLIIDLPLFMGTTFSVAMFYWITQREEGNTSAWRVIGRIPLVLSVGIGLCVNQTRAVLEALTGKPSEFVRTPKTGVVNRFQKWTRVRYRSKLTWVSIVELLLGVYFLVTLVVAARGGHWLSVPFIFLFFLGFWYVGLTSILQSRSSSRRA
ncbi:MAG: glycosyltransferase family 2 protein [Deltaproteobacteria bacterium]|nr:glycosyltransferase family 2 protein [Deltaproteobacteria bacterium]